MSLRRILPFILINVVVSTAVVLAILFWWDNRLQSTAGGELPLVQEPQNSAEAADPSVDQTLAQSQPTLTPVVTEGPPQHVVQPGETLGSISELYDVPLDDIMTANGLTNPNIISVGQLLTIPINGLPQPAAVAEATLTDPNVIPTPIGTVALPAGTFDIEISQVLGVGDVATEAVQIRNVGSSSVALQNWRIADQDGFFYTFGQLTLFGDGAGILVHTGSGQDSVTEVYWGLDSAVWEVGELITLLDAEGDIAATLTIQDFSE